MSYTIICRLKSNYIIIPSIALFVLAFLSWIIGSELLTIFFSYGEDCAVSYWEHVCFLFDSFLTWEFFIESAMRYVCLIFPIFVSIPSIAFYDEIHGTFQYCINRFKNYKKELIKSSLCYVIIGGLVVVVPLTVLIMIANFFLVPSLNGIGGLSAVFPDGFYFRYPFIVFLFMITVLYFLLACTYSIISCGLALFVRNKVVICVIPVLVFYAENIMAYLSGGWLPLSTMDVLTSFNTLRTFESLLIPVGVNFILATLIYIVCYKYRIAQEVVE